MKKVVQSVVFLCVLFVVSTSQAAGKGYFPHVKNGRIEVIAQNQHPDYNWLKFQVYDDEPYPLTIDLLVPRRTWPKRIMYMLPASGSNFQTSYFFNTEYSMATHMVGAGYVVVGVTFREDAVPTEHSQTAVADWGATKHAQDLRKIVKLMKIFPLPYEVLAHSFTAAAALEYAARYKDLRRLVLMDYYSFDPETQTAEITAAHSLVNAIAALEVEGLHSDNSLHELQSLIMGAALYPDADSGVSREFMGLPGNFTLNGLLHFWSIYSANMPGLHTHITGLPRDWPLIQASMAGYYLPAVNPLEDEFAFYNIDVHSLTSVAMQMGSGVLPVALIKDAAAIASYHPSKPLQFERITADVLWINMQLGYGDMQHAAQLMTRASVTTHVVEGYGNVDFLYSSSAQQDVWELIAN